MQSDFSYNHQYTLRWNDYHVKLVNSFQSLHDADDFVDVTIACEGKSFSAHKVVLSACSPYFRRLLKANPCSHPIIILQKIQHRQFENLINFMYNGVVHIEPEKLHEFLHAANELQIQGLTDIQYPQNLRRKISTESDVSASSSNVNESRDIGPAEKNIRLTDEKPTVKSQNDLTNIDNIIDMNFPSPNYSEHSKIPKNEPIDDLVIDEDAFEQDIPDNLPKPPDISALNESNIYAHQSTNFTENIDKSSANFDPYDNFNIAKRFRDPTSTESNRCVVCKRNYSSPSNLRAHVLNVHIETSQTNWFECSVCRKKCKTKHYLINHEMQKHGIRQRSKTKVFSLDMSNEDTL